MSSSTIGRKKINGEGIALLPEGGGWLLAESAAMIRKS